MPDGLLGLVLRAAALRVPRHGRATWLREWQGELAEARRQGRASLPLLLGVMADAGAVRREARARRTGKPGGKGGMGIEDVVVEVRRASRSLVRAPGFAVASVVTLGVGLAAAAALFTLVDAVLLRPLPYPAPDRLVRVFHTMKDGGETTMTRHTYLLVRDQARTLDALGAWEGPNAATLEGSEGPAERVRAVTATASLLDVLGARAARGRLFGEDDDRPGAPGVAVLGWGLWQRRFGGDPGVVGRTVEVDGEPVEVVGVMDAGVQLPTADVDLWRPERIDPAARPTDEFRLHAVGRLAPGADLADAAAELDALDRRLPEVAPFFDIYLRQFGFGTSLRPLQDEVVGDVERPLWVLLGAVGLVLLVAVGNVANLFLVRAEARRREVALRSALGARRGRLVGHYLAESALVAAAAGAVGVGLAALAVRVLVRLAPPSIPRLNGLAVGGATVALVVALCAAVALALGLYPYLRFGRGAAAGAGAAGAGARGTGDRSQAATGDALVVGQVALALVLLSSAALLFRSFQNLRGVDVGFDASGILAADVALPADGYPSDDAALAFLDAARARIGALPGVEAVAVGPSPMALGGGCSGLYREDETLPPGSFPPCAGMTQVGAGWAGLLDVPVVAGRNLTPAEVADGAPVALVSQALARRLWPGQDPLGRGIRPAPRKGPPWYRVVGVLGDVRGAGPREPPVETVYFPPAMALDPWGPLRSTALLIRTDARAEASVAGALRGAIAELDPRVPVTVLGRVSDEVARSMVRTSFTLFLLGTASLTALVLGLVGLYGVVAYRVGSRTAEIGVRMALGARGGQVRALALGHSLRLVAVGTALGLGGALLLTRFLGSLLYGVRAGDPLVLAAATGALLATALAASWIPARRASRVDPAVALRGE